MKLYYLTSKKWATKILLENRIKISDIDELNDPFELLGVSIGDKSARRVVRYAKQTLSDMYGLVCLSKTWKSPVMWAHYGDKHKGVCLCFEVDQSRLHEVIYKPDKLTTLLSNKPSLSDFDFEALKILISTKSIEWEYEKEYRLLLKYSEADSCDEGKHYLKFYSGFRLEEVILGARCDLKVSDIPGMVSQVEKKVKVRKVRPSFQKFEMVNHGRVNPIFIQPKSEP